MKEEKKPKERKQTAEEKKQGANEKQEGKGEKKEPKPRSPYLYAAAVAIVIIVAVAALFTVSGTFNGVSFSSFKQNFNSASKVAVVLNYTNLTVLNTKEYLCAQPLLEILEAHSPPPTIDLLVINSTSCTEDVIAPPKYAISPINTTPAACLSIAGSEPSISLNYSAQNYTVVRPYHISVFGDYNYMRSCPIAVDMS